MKKLKRKNFDSFLKSAKILFGTNNHHNTGEQRKRNREDHLHMTGKDLSSSCSWRCSTDLNSERSLLLLRDFPVSENNWNSRKHQADRLFNGPWRSWIKNGYKQWTMLLLLSLKKAETHRRRFHWRRNESLLSLVLSQNQKKNQEKGF